jgi:hypothetical protein
VTLAGQGPELILLGHQGTINELSLQIEAF